jgi:hypothetical protein
MKQVWLYSLRTRTTLVVISVSSTSNGRKHIKQVHLINISIESTPSKRRGMEREIRRIICIKNCTMLSTSTPFAFYLIRLAVERHILFTVVENADFQAMVKALNSTVNKSLLKSSDIIRNKVEDNFLGARNAVKEKVLAMDISSKIHVSCTFRTSPNGYAIYGVVDRERTRW